MSLQLALAVVLILSVGTYLMRAGMILALADRSLPPLLLTALGHVPAAVLAAMVVTIAADPGTCGLQIDETAALVAAALVSYWRKNLIITVVVGMAVLFATAALT